MVTELRQVEHDVEEVSRRLAEVRRQVGRVIVGQQRLVDRLLIALLCNGHVLIEGVPGLAKTLVVTTLAQTLQARFQRIQFTPDLLPGDLIGTLVFNPRTGEFHPHKGPIFCNILLADEINRSPAKVQSALLEAMQERQVTIGDRCYLLDDPFLVLATQNPIEQEGTYPLPEAQVDRFLFKLKVDYPSRDEEREIVHRMARSQPDLQVPAVLSCDDVAWLRRTSDAVYVDPKVVEYVLDLVEATRRPERFGLELSDLIQYGASPRASIFLVMAAKAHALLQGRPYVVPQDVKDVGLDVLRHRVILTYEAEAEEKTPEDIVQQIFDSVEVP